jgi:homoserine dehydrogenase
MTQATFTATGHLVLDSNPIEPRTVRVAIAGCGVVGGDLVRLIRESASDVLTGDGVRLEIVSVLVRRPEIERGLPLSPELITSDVSRFQSASADIVVEAIGGTGVAREIVEDALARGARVVTANKALVARHGAELATLAARAGGRLDFEAAVGGGVPIVRSLRDSLSSSGVVALRGILNGTTNYILSRLAEGTPFDEALALARRLGFAEANPERDLNGSDAADKIAILSWLAFGIDPARLAVRTRGIVGTADRLAADAKAFGGVLRLVAEARAHSGGVTAAVEPTIVSADSELGRARDETNVVQVKTRWNGTVTTSGPGAGGRPTAAALLGDVRSAARPLAVGIAAGAVGSGRAEPETPPARWVVSIRRESGVGSELRAELRHTGVHADRLEIDSESGVIRALLDPAKWDRVDALETRLRRAGFDPVVSRYLV